MMLFKLLIALLMLLSNGFKLEYNHVPNAKNGYYTIYDNNNICIHDDIQLLDIYDVLIE